MHFSILDFDRVEQNILTSLVDFSYCKTVVDGGASDGLFTFPILEKMGPEGILHAIEPDASSASVLLQRQSQHPFGKNIVYYPETLGSEDSLTTRKLDTLIPGFVDLLKLDIEGHEYNALCGAQKICLQPQLLLWMECHLCFFERSGQMDRARTMLLNLLNHHFFLYHVNFRKDAFFSERFMPLESQHVDKFIHEFNLPDRPTWIFGAKGYDRELLENFFTKGEF